MDDQEAPSRSEIWQFIFDVRDGEANPEDARRLMRYFCDVVKGRGQPVPELLDYMRHAFETYLSGEKGIEAALGLRRKTGKPKADPETRTNMALAVLHHRLNGMPHLEALEEVAEGFECGKTIVSDAWREYKRDAMVWLRLERSETNEGFTPEEMEKFEEMFKKEPWLIPRAPERPME